MLYGEPLFAAVVADQAGLSLVEPPFDWLTKVPGPCVKRDIRLTTLEEARRLRARAFFKPADDKCFAHGVYDSGEPSQSLTTDEYGSFTTTLTVPSGVQTVNALADFPIGSPVEVYATFYLWN